MRKYIFSKSLLFLLLASSVWGSNTIYLKSRYFTPHRGIDEETRAKLESTGNERVHVLLQLDYIPTIKQRNSLKAKGIRLLSYVPDRAWFASIPPKRVAEIARMPGIRAIAEILPDDKIAESIRNGGVSDFSTTFLGQARLIAFFFDDVALGTAAKVVENLGGMIVDACPKIIALVIHLPKNRIYELASHDYVRWINQHHEASACNDGARAAVDVDDVQSSPYNLTGNGVVVGQWDGGCADPNHDDLAGRIIHADYNCTSATQGLIEHATHVAGTIAGDGALNSTYEGMAP
jgi:hypothetical protein